MAYSSYTDTVVCEIRELPDKVTSSNGELAVKQITDPNNLASVDFIRSMSMDLFSEIYAELENCGANRIAFDWDPETGEYIFVGLKCEPDLTEAEIKQEKIEILQYKIDCLTRESTEYESWMNTYRRTAEKLTAELQELKDDKTVI